jgi:hypothetical protein
MSPKRPEKFRGFHKTKKVVGQTLEFIYMYEKRPLSSLNNSLPELEKQLVELLKGIKDNKDNPTVRSVLEFKVGVLEKRVKEMKSGKVTSRRGSKLDKDSREGKNLIDELKGQLQEVMRTLSKLEEKDKTWTSNDFLGMKR